MLQDEGLTSPEQWLLELHHASRLEGGGQLAAQSTYESVKRCIIAVLPDVTDITVRRTDPEFYADPAIRVEFLTPYGWVAFEQLGLGYQSVSAWAVDLLKKLHVTYQDLEKPETGPAVVLIDEFDLHLHPKWQLTLMEHLGAIFTHTQFIITAHSPLIVQAAGADTNIVLLRKETDAEGQNWVVADNDPVRVRGWRLDQLVTSELFGMESARPTEFAQLFKERSALVRKGNRTPEEEARLQEITERIEREAPPSISVETEELIKRLKAVQ